MIFLTLCVCFQQRPFGLMNTRDEPDQDGPVHVLVPLPVSKVLAGTTPTRFCGQLREAIEERLPLRLQGLSPLEPSWSW